MKPTTVFQRELKDILIGLLVLPLALVIWSMMVVPLAI